MDHEQKLLSVFLQSPLDFVKTFSRVLLGSDEISLLSRSILFILKTHEDHLEKLLTWSIKKELETIESHVAPLFTGSALHVSLFLDYCHIFGGNFISMIGKSIHDIAEKYKKYELEIDPKLAPLDHAANSDRLRAMTESIMKEVLKNHHKCPWEIRKAFQILYNKAIIKCNGMQTTITACVFFNQFIVLPILRAEQYGLARDNIKQRTAVSISKLFRQISMNNVNPAGYMSKFKDMVESLQPELKNLVDEIVSPKERLEKSGPPSQESLQKPVRCIRYFIYMHKDAFHSKSGVDHVINQANTIMEGWELLEGKPELVDNLLVDPPNTGRLTKGIFKRKSKPQSKNALGVRKMNKESLKSSPSTSTSGSSRGGKKFDSEENDSRPFDSQGSDHTDEDRLSNSDANDMSKSELDQKDDDNDTITCKRRSNTSDASLGRALRWVVPQLPDKVIPPPPIISQKTEEEKQMADFNLKLLKSLLYRQKKNEQVKQASIFLQYEHTRSLDDDLWDYEIASPNNRKEFITKKNGGEVPFPQKFPSTIKMTNNKTTQNKLKLSLSGNLKSRIIKPIEIRQTKT